MFLFFPHTLDFIIFIYIIYVIYLFIYFYVYYNTNFTNIKLEYCSSEPRTFFLQRWNIIFWT
jgi:hypothetical protein